MAHERSRGDGHAPRSIRKPGDGTRQEQREGSNRPQQEGEPRYVRIDTSHAQLYKMDIQEVGTIVRRGRETPDTTRTPERTAQQWRETWLNSGTGTWESTELTHAGKLLESYHEQVRNAFIRSHLNDNATLLKQLEKIDTLPDSHKTALRDLPPNIQTFLLGLEERKPAAPPEITLNNTLLLDGFLQSRDTNREKFFRETPEHILKHVLSHEYPYVNDRQIGTFLSFSRSQRESFLSRPENVQFHILDNYKATRRDEAPEPVQELAKLPRKLKAVLDAQVPETQCAIIDHKKGVRETLKAIASLPKELREPFDRLDVPSQVLALRSSQSLHEASSKLNGVSEYAREMLHSLPDKTRDALFSEKKEEFQTRITTFTELATTDPRMLETLRGLPQELHHGIIAMDKATMYTFLSKTMDLSDETRVAFNQFHPDLQHVVLTLPGSQIETAIHGLQSVGIWQLERVVKSGHTSVTGEVRHFSQNHYSTQELQNLVQGGIQAVEQRAPLSGQYAQAERSLEETLKDFRHHPVDTLQEMRQSFYDGFHAARQEDRRAMPQSIDEAQIFREAVREFSMVGIKTPQETRAFLDADRRGEIQRRTFEDVRNDQKARRKNDPYDFDDGYRSIQPPGITWKGQFYPVPNW